MEGKTIQALHITTVAPTDPNLGVITLLGL